MSDLTKLTVDELRVRFDVLRPKMNVPARLVLAEISLRLERLEQCEAAIAKCKHAGECGYDAARAALEEK